MGREQEKGGGESEGEAREREERRRAGEDGGWESRRRGALRWL